MKNKPKTDEQNPDLQFGYWNAQIGLLKAGADKAKAGAKVEYHKTIEAFHSAISKFK